jgi:hypothetical protein
LGRFAKPWPKRRLKTVACNIPMQARRTDPPSIVLLPAFVEWVGLPAPELARRMQTDLGPRCTVDLEIQGHRKPPGRRNQEARFNTHNREGIPNAPIPAASFPGE